MARNAVAMPDAVVRNCRRDIPCFFASSPPRSLIRASTRRCLSVWGAGMNSSLETLWVGMGPGKDDVSAPRRAFRSLSLRSLMSFLLGAGMSVGPTDRLQELTHRHHAAVQRQVIVHREPESRDVGGGAHVERCGGPGMGG